MSKADRTRQLIVEKTAPIFNVKGYAGTSLSDLTEATGLTKGSVYGNFANKEEVAVAAFEHNWAKARAAIHDAMDRQRTSKGKLLALVGVYDDIPHDFPEGGCPLLNTAVEADDTNPTLRAQAVAAFRSWKKSVVGVIETGISAREFRADVDAEQTALSLIAMIEGAVMIARLTGNARYRRAVTPTMRKIIDDLS